MGIIFRSAASFHIFFWSQLLLEKSSLTFFPQKEEKIFSTFLSHSSLDTVQNFLPFCKSSLLFYSSLSLFSHLGMQISYIQQWKWGRLTLFKNNDEFWEMKWMYEFEMKKSFFVTYTDRWASIFLSTHSSFAVSSHTYFLPHLLQSLSQQQFTSTHLFPVSSTATHSSVT